jgi:dihydropyrimidine dehydrogenase (NAD+) subunit PreA
VKEVARVPVLVKLTPNITDVRYAARAAKAGKGDGVSLINTINSVMGVNLDTLEPTPKVGGQMAHGGYCGPAVKPIALHMVSSIATDPETKGFPISGIGGVSTWRDAVEFMLLGASSVQVCTAVMHYGFRIVEDMIDGLGNWMDEKGYRRLEDFIGKSVPKITDWKNLNLHYKSVAKINADKCIGCDLCYVACWDAAHQCIEMKPSSNGKPKNHGAARAAHVVEEDCVGCNLCSLVCPVDGCIEMVEVKTGNAPLTWDQYVKGGMKGYKESYKKRHIHPEAK